MDSMISNHPAPAAPPAEHPLLALPREDLDLIVELVLQSGSLKGLASSYGVSYPTIRARLDKTIERLRAVIQGATPDPIADLLARLVERGELSVSGARALRDTLRQTNQAHDPAHQEGSQS
ncbi:MAG: DUF2089 family protein [Phycisphaerales bacterium]